MTCEATTPDPPSAPSLVWSVGRAAVRDVVGVLHLFMTTSYGVVQRAILGEGHVPLRWETIGRGACGTPSVLYHPDDGRFDVFVAGRSGRILTSSHLGPGHNGWWSRWSSIGGSGVATASAVRDRDGLTRIIATTATGHVQHAYGGSGRELLRSWRWQTIEAAATFRGTPGVLADSAGRSVTVFAATTEGAVLGNTLTGEVWRGWRGGISGTGMARELTVALDEHNRACLFSIDTSFRVRRAVQPDTWAPTWTWQDLGGAFHGAPSVVQTPGSGRYDVFAYAANDRISTRASIHGRWTAWHVLP